MAHGMEAEGTRILAQLEDKDSVDHPAVILKKTEIQVSLAQESAGGMFMFPFSMAYVKL